MNLAYKIEDPTNAQIQELLYNWIEWLRTRKFYAPPLPRNILDLQQVNTMPSRGEPDAKNDAMCAAFNLVISNTPDDERIPFLCAYLKEYRPTPIKTIAAALNITRETFYKRAQQAAPKIYTKTLELAELNRQMQKEVDGFID